jgi:hypothetical protein
VAELECGHTQRTAMLLRFTMSLALGVGLLCGCAANTHPPRTTQQGEPDCSFRSAASCWTLGPRFPSKRIQSDDTRPDDALRQPTATLANTPDSTGGIASSSPRIAEDP